MVVEEYCECFTLTAEEFLELLWDYHEKERTRKSDVIRAIPEMARVREGDVKRAIDSSHLKTFTKGNQQLHRLWSMIDFTLLTANE